MSNAEKCIKENQENVPPLIELLGGKKIDNVDHRLALGQIQIDGSCLKAGIEKNKVDANQTETARKNQTFPEPVPAELPSTHNTSPEINVADKQSYLQTTSKDLTIGESLPMHSTSIQQSLSSPHENGHLSSQCKSFGEPLPSYDSFIADSAHLDVLELSNPSVDQLASDECASELSTHQTLSSDLTSSWAGIVELDDVERWKERNVVLTSIDHNENIQIAKEMLDEVLTRVFTKVNPPPTDEDSKINSNENACATENAITPSDVHLNLLEENMITDEILEVEKLGNENIGPSKNIKEFFECHLSRTEDTSSIDEVFLSPPQSPCELGGSVEIYCATNHDVVSINSDKISSCGSNYISCMDNNFEESSPSDGNASLNISPCTEIQEHFMCAYDSPLEDSTGTAVNSTILRKLSAEPSSALSDNQLCHLTLNTESTSSPVTSDNFITNEQCKTDSLKFTANDNEVFSDFNIAPDKSLHEAESPSSNDCNDKISPQAGSLIKNSDNTFEEREPVITENGAESLRNVSCEPEKLSSTSELSVNFDKENLSTDKLQSICLSGKEFTNKYEANSLLSDSLPLDSFVKTEQSPVEQVEAQNIGNVAGEHCVGKYLSEFSSSFLESFGNDKQECTVPFFSISEKHDQRIENQQCISDVNLAENENLSSPTSNEKCVINTETILGPTCESSLNDDAAGVSLDEVAKSENYYTHQPNITTVQTSSKEHSEHLKSIDTREFGYYSVEKNSDAQDDKENCPDNSSKTSLVQNKICVDELPVSSPFGSEVNRISEDEISKRLAVHEASNSDTTSASEACILPHIQESTDLSIKSTVDKESDICLQDNKENNYLDNKTVKESDAEAKFDEIPLKKKDDSQNVISNNDEINLIESKRTDTSKDKFIKCRNSIDNKPTKDSLDSSVAEFTDISHLNSAGAQLECDDSFVSEQDTVPIKKLPVIAEPLNSEIGGGDAISSDISLSTNNLSNSQLSDSNEKSDFKIDSVGLDQDMTSLGAKLPDTKSSEAQNEMLLSDEFSDKILQPDNSMEISACDQVLKNQPEKNPALDEIAEGEIFYPATDFFKDAEAFEFLQKAGNTKAAEESKFTRISLFQKFDPLLKMQSPVKKQLDRMADKSEIETAKRLENLNFCLQELDELSNSQTLCDSEQKDIIVETPVTSQNSKLIDLSLSPKQDGSTLDDVQQPSDTCKEEETIKTFNEDEVQQILKKQELLFQEQLINKDKEGHEKMNANKKEIENLRKERLILEQAIFSTRGVTEELLSVIAGCMQQKDQERIEITTCKQQVIAERDQALEDLRGVEKAFSDLHHRYEKSKKVLEIMKQNEEKWKQQLEDLQIKINEHQQMYDMLKQRSEEKLDSAFNDLDEVKKSADSDHVVMQAMLRKSEMKIEGLERSLEQKVREIEELTSIYDDLVTKVRRE